MNCYTRNWEFEQRTEKGEPKKLVEKENTGEERDSRNEREIKLRQEKAEVTETDRK
jgi:hypothetical protein